MFTYISNGTDAARSTSTSSLTLQQHLTHHYRVLAAAQPTVDTGQRRQRKRRQDGRRRWRHGADSAETPSTTESADDRRLVEAILGDDRLPPQYYCRQQQELDSSPPEEGNSLLREPPDGPSPAAADTILGKIDSYLNRVHATKDDKRVKAGGAARHGQAAPPSRAPPRAAGRPCPSPHKPPPAVPVRSLVSRKRKLLTGDVIERFPQDFTTKRPFRPQVLRTSASPRLRYLRVYRGPVAVPRSSGGRPRGQQQSHSLGSSSASAASGSSGGQSVHHSRDRSEQQESGEETQEDYQEDTGDEYTSGEDGEEEEEEEDKEEDAEEAYENDFEEEEGGDVEQESSGGVSSRVPPLSISPDSDQEAWLREQASKAVTRQRAVHVVKTNYRSPSKDSAYNGGFSSCSRGPTPEETAGHRPAARGPPRVRPMVVPPAPPSAARPAQRFADEQAYVQFLNDVTSDILARGVFTNRILKRVMAAHVDKHRGKLDTTRMRTELERLRLQLGIPDDDALDDAEHGFGCVGGGGDGSSGGGVGGDANGPAAAQTAGRPTPPSPLVLEHHPPTFVDSLLFPTGESWERRGVGAGSAGSTALVAPSGGPAAAPPGGRQVALEGGDPPESMAALLASLSLDESVTQTILSCCQKQTDAASITSEELRECLNWRTPHTDVT